MYVIDWDKVDELLEWGCDGTQIAAYLGMHPETLYDRCKSEKNTDFSAYKQEKRAKGDVSILKAQFESATKDKNIPMLIWVGKQRLGQKDKSEVDNNIKIDPPQAININGEPWQPE